MRTEICDLFGIDVPIFAFTHCRDVVVAVSKAGGLGVLGAVGFTPEQLETELVWIDERIGGKPYGVDTGPLPWSPIRSGHPDESIILVPYGSTKIRISEFPIVI